MTARFILSLDCEGKWGVADILGPREQETLSDARLRRAYSDIVALLDRLSVPATFAFVGLFGETPEDFRRLGGELQALSAAAPHYLSPALVDIESGSREGWHGAWAVDSVGAAKAGHEIALHGVTHVPWGTVDEGFARAELALLERLRPEIRGARTFIYPRNDVAHAQLLPGAGVEGYRLAPPRRSRARSLASEANIFSRPEKDPPAGNPIAIPAGYFVNYQHGPRRLVPQLLSLLRLRNLLDRAERTGEVVHYWLHPENVAAAPATLDLLRATVEEVARRRDAGRCRVLTQIGYCRERAGGRAAAAA